MRKGLFNILLPITILTSGCSLGKYITNQSSEDSFKYTVPELEVKFSDGAKEVADRAIMNFVLSEGKTWSSLTIEDFYRHYSSMDLKRPYGIISYKEANDALKESRIELLKSNKKRK